MADTYKRTIRAWALYDWANSAFACTIMAAMLPPFFSSLVKDAGYDPAQATQWWGYTSAGALLLVALMGPILGAIADVTGGKKRFLAVFLGIGLIGTALLATLTPEMWWLAPIWYTLGFLGFGGGNVFYESLLPHIAREDDTDRVSAFGYAMGYIGGGLLLAVNALMVMKPELFGIADAGVAVRLCFLSVTAWWLGFSLPLFRRVPEPPAAPPPSEGVGQVRQVGLDNDTEPETISPVSAGFAQLIHTFKNVRRYKHLLLFLVAFWIYDDGIGTIIKMATIYGAELGFGQGDLIGALLLTQFIGFPCALAFGPLARRITAKGAIFFGLAVYGLICIAGFFMTTPLHFYILAALVGTVQGGTQAISRSLFSAMTPRHLSAEFFGFFSTSSKFAGIVGPLLMAGISAATGSSRLGILALIVLFVAGGALLLFVDVDAGRRAARDAEREAGIL